MQLHEYMAQQINTLKTKNDGDIIILSLMVVTERQFNAIDVLVGEKSIYDTPQETAQLMEF